MLIFHPAAPPGDVAFLRLFLSPSTPQSPHEPGIQTSGELSARVLARFPVSLNLRPYCGFRDNSGRVLAGTLNGAMSRQLESAWAEDTYGSWQGAPPPLFQAWQLEARTGNGLAAPQTREGFDLVSQVPSGASFLLHWFGRQVVAENFNLSEGGGSCQIFSASDGAIVFDSASLGGGGALMLRVPIAVPALESGSYVAYVFYGGIVEGLRLPPGYARDAKYDYTTQSGRKSHYNPLLHVGEVPADLNHPLRIERRQLIADNAQKDRSEYSRFLTNEAAQESEGSAIKLQIGGGAWAQTAGVFCTPSRPLFECDATVSGGDTEPVALSIDPLCRAITCAVTTSTGRVLLGGGRMSAFGTMPGVWEWNEATKTATPLGTCENACSAICEEMLSIGLATGIVERSDRTAKNGAAKEGSIVLLTLCSRHQLDEKHPEAAKRLPRWINFGEPGGRALTSITGAVAQDAEGFFSPENQVAADGETANHYASSIFISSDGVAYVPGVTAHVDSALWAHKDKVWGVRTVVPAAPGQPRYLHWTYQENGSWNKTSARKWRSLALLLTRGGSLGTRQLAFGCVPRFATGRAARDDGNYTEILAFPWRVRLLQSSRNESGARTLVAPARAVVDENTIAPDWCLIETDGKLVGEAPGGGGDPDNPHDNPQDVLDDDPTLLYRLFSMKARGGASGVLADTNRLFVCDADGRLRDLNAAHFGDWLWARFDSDAPVGDLTSYTTRVGYGGRPFVSDEPARLVEFCVIVPPTLFEIDLPLPLRVD